MKRKLIAQINHLATHDLGVIDFMPDEIDEGLNHLESLTVNQLKTLLNTLTP